MTENQVRHWLSRTGDARSVSLCLYPHTVYQSPERSTACHVREEWGKERRDRCGFHIIKSKHFRKGSHYSLLKTSISNVAGGLMLVAFIFLLVQHFPWWITLLHQLCKVLTCAVPNTYHRCVFVLSTKYLSRVIVWLVSCKFQSPFQRGDGQETNNSHGKLLQTNRYHGKSCTGLHPWFDFFPMVICIIMLLPPEQWVPDCPWASCRAGRAVRCEWTTKSIGQWLSMTSSCYTSVHDHTHTVISVPVEETDSYYQCKFHIMFHVVLSGWIMGLYPHALENQNGWTKELEQVR